MNEPEARAAHDAARTVDLTVLRPAPTGWQRAAEVAGVIAAGLAIGAAVIPW